MSGVEFGDVEDSDGGADGEAERGEDGRQAGK